LRQSLSLADVIAVDHAFGFGFATKFVAEVDIWVNPADNMKSSISVKSCIQSNQSFIV
jgi:hypothetical protein